MYEGVWHLTDYRNDSMYLIEGDEKVLLIDTGMGKGDLKAFIGTLTQKPLEVVITHAHWDHIMQADQFETVYLNHKDFQLIEMFNLEVNYKDFLDVKEPHVFDLGGRSLEVIEVPGHTPGSIVLLDRKNGLLFSGDAVGAGHTWMHLPGCLPLSVYLESLKRLQRLNGFKKIYHGHLRESNVFGPQYLDDLIKAVELVLEGTLKGEPYPSPNEAFKGLYVTYGSAVLVYDPNNLKA
ncbi:MAG: MBL fold metallo-hydrolase [Pseudothermotoga sp.]|nr:MBL fold metallo-hydrolase [Pseudothermotoga sp.]